MGDNNPPQSYDVDEKPAHSVYLDGYYIYKNDVTVAEYKKFCDATGRMMPDPPQWGWDKASYPVVNVSWDDAVAYAKWAGASLPTEAQWEKAARGTDGRTYPWGNQWDPAKCRNNASEPSPVGSYPAGASPYGVMDMAGNVWQWCSDWYGADYYGSSPPPNPTGPAGGEYRVLRGGGWGSSDGDDFRCARRLRGAPDIVIDFGGFRCASRAGSP
jgi:sulfatase modifying factor 1